tara:strand:+ start:385 stop:558 length:174 start_codon:yes stop_codon:yes gene_type:complete
MNKSFKGKKKFNISVKKPVDIKPIIDCSKKFNLIFSPFNNIIWKIRPFEKITIEKIA